MRLYVLAIVASIVIVPHAVRAADPLPPQEPRVVLPSPAHFQPAHFRLAPSSEQQLEHLKAAAEHLAKAGRKQEAARLLQQVAVAESGQAAALLAKKEQELDRLQAEVEQLRKAAQGPTMISLKFHVMEVSPAKLKSAKVGDFNVLFPKSDGKHEGFAVLKDPTQVEAAIDRLRKKGLIKVLAAPTMATTSGRALQFNAGAEVPTLEVGKDGKTVLKIVQIGTKIEAHPVLMDNGKLQLALCLRVTDRNDGGEEATNGKSTPSVHVRKMQTAIEMEFDRVFMLRGLRQPRQLESQPASAENPQDLDDGVETVVLITAKQLHVPKRATYSHVPASYAAPKQPPVFPNPINFGGVTPRVIIQEEEEEVERLINE